MTGERSSLFSLAAAGVLSGPYCRHYVSLRAVLTERRRRLITSVGHVAIGANHRRPGHQTRAHLPRCEKWVGSSYKSSILLHTADHK